MLTFIVTSKNTTKNTTLHVKYKVPLHMPLEKNKSHTYDTIMLTLFLIYTRLTHSLTRLFHSNIQLAQAIRYSDHSIIPLMLHRDHDMTSLIIITDYG